MGTPCLLALLAAAATFAPSHTTDVYIKYFTDVSRREYYTQTANILHNDYFSIGDPRMEKVDEMIHDYVDIATQPTVYKDCIPFVSEYTDCSIHNICHGCMTCHCDVVGRWNCSDEHRCRPEPRLDLDHRTLAMAMENLLEDEHTLLKRRKRSLHPSKDYADVSKWFYGISPFEIDHENTTLAEVGESTTTVSSEPDYINFEQFLIDVVGGLHFGDGSQVNDTHIEEINRNTRDDSNYLNFVNMLKNVSTVTEPDIEVYENITAKDTLDNKLNTSNLNIQYTKGRKIKLLHNLRKRELLNTSDIHSIGNVAVFIKNITENTFHPLDSIINIKEDELNELKTIRDNLLASIDAFVGMKSIDSNSTFNKTDIQFVIYKLDYSNNNRSLRKDNKDVLRNYQIKLERDIQEVIKDIAIIQRVTKSQNIPQEYKYLIRALRNFVKRKTNPHYRKKKLGTNNFRRHYNATKPRKFNPLLLINNILDFLDKDMPQENILPLLSRHSMKIIVRLMKQLHTDELSYVNMKIRDNNIINDINEIGYRWEYKMADILNCTPSEKLVKIKSFHLELSKAIDTIKDTLTLIEFAQRRRMSLINDHKSERVVMEHLIKIHNDIDRINKLAKKPQTPTIRRTGKKTKHGFLQKVKKLLKKSKKDIRGILKKKSPNEALKRIAKKRLDEMAKKKLLRYENAMQKWREDFNMAPRMKRSPNEFNKFINRVKNIFPGYPRKKANQNKNGTRHNLKSKNKNKKKKKKKKEESKDSSEEAFPRGRQRSTKQHSNTSTVKPSRAHHENSHHNKTTQ